jgi:hypothetical protein
MKHSVRPHAFGWAVVKHDHPGGTVVETFESRSVALTLADALNKQAERAQADTARPTSRRLAP